MRILTLHGVHSSGRTTFLCYAAAALVKRDVKRRVASDNKVRVLILGRTSRSTFVLRNMFLDETENLGITGRDPERGDYVLHSDVLTPNEIPAIPLAETDYVLADDVDWRTLYDWANTKGNRICQLFYAGDPKPVSFQLTRHDHVSHEDQNNVFA